MMKILGTGLNGLVGSRIVELLKDKYNFTNISRLIGVDITYEEQITRAIISSDAPIVLHMAAKTDVDGCEKDKALGHDGEAWRVNVLGTQYVTNACKKTNKKLIYISTDFVFDGTRGNYSEEESPNPINWYGMTKFKGEEYVRGTDLPFLILRPAYPYGHLFEKKKDFVQAILARLRSGNTVIGVTDHIFVPTFIDDLASSIDVLITRSAEGIYHAVGSKALTPYEASLIIAQIFGLDSSLVIKTTREVYFKNRAARPYNLSLRNDKIERLGIEMRGFEEGLKEIRNSL